jgi:hypothetical protein
LQTYEKNKGRLVIRHARHIHHIHVRSDLHTLFFLSPFCPEEYLMPQPVLLRKTPKRTDH